MILGILQARFSSTRFPGKVLADLHGRPMIVRQLERLARSELIDRLVVATSSDPSDDPLVAEVEAAGIEIRRGPLDDVVERFQRTIQDFAPDHVVRLTADCPLTDATVVDLIIRRHLESSSDYTSNVLEPTFPDGLDAECFTSAAFARLVELPLTAREREHVTLGMYTRADAFSLLNVSQTPDRSDLRWTVDVPADLDFVRAVFDHLYDEDQNFGQPEILALLDEHPELRRTERDLARNAGLEPG